MADPVSPTGGAPLRPMVCFDGDCGMCRASVELIVRLGLVQRGRIAPFQSFDAEVAGKLLEANVHNELAVLDTESHEIRSGVDGLLWAFEGSWLSPLLPLTRPRPVRAALALGYRLVAYNRRLISPIRTEGIRCACDPDFHLGLRLGFLGLCVLVVVGLTLLGGLGLWPAGVGAVLGVAALTRRGDGAGHVDSLGHAAWALLLATIACLPYGFTEQAAWLSLPTLVLLASASRRHVALGVARPVAWTLALTASVAGALVATLGA